MDHYVMTEAQRHANAVFVMIAVWGSIGMSLIMLILLGLNLREPKPPQAKGK
jgi:hypothetical protein